MADPVLKSYAEARAQEAVRFEAFAVNLSEIKRVTSELLSQIGKHGLFSEYTKHDISHIDEVLDIAGWLVDDDTKQRMSDADWFLITLSIYFHDLGMMVTKDEYDNRDQSSFTEFCNTQLFSGPRSDEYKARVNELGPAERELFLYQEFVRASHAKRVRHWIEGTLDNRWGVSTAAVGELTRVLSTLDDTLRRDLALIAESHHLDDLDQLNKYRVIQPYGPSDAETANLQYCAIILRSADLLHMRRDRTPSVLFRTINPTDPISQREWAKQNAVRRVMPRRGLNEDGAPDETATKDTIEVHARFTEENGFFGLTSFLSYASSEIRKCHDWVEASKKAKGSKHSFVWKRIADDLIEAEGFLKETYSFDLDQHKILDLLIGHTLYNDTGVVLREIAQNGIDAIRLSEQRDPKTVGEGKLGVTWSTKERILTITDNGTGMTQEVIEKHLLKVGSSLYQDQEFRKRNPNFSPISRFGIGVLSAFMVSDEVDITTSSPEEEKARKISLRSVHGRYLVRTLDKNRDEEAQSLAPHGTRVRLKVRSTAKLGSVVDIMRQWVVIPGCSATVTIDNGEAVSIGYKSVGDVVEAILGQHGFSTEGDTPPYKVMTRSADGVDFAYAARWSAYFRDWSIATIDTQRGFPMPCTCVEGIAVVFGTPAMSQNSFIAVANARGPNAPKTNVARSTLEVTPQRDALYSSVYGLYVDHVQEEIGRLLTKENYSLTWSVNNAVTLVPFNLTNEASSDAVLPNILRDRMKKLPIYIVEQNGTRTNISFEHLVKERTFWTVDSELLRSAEQLVREAKSSATVSSIVAALGDKSQALPAETVLYNIDVSHILRDAVEAEFEPLEVVAEEKLRRSAIKWGARTTTSWIRMDDVLKRIKTRQRTQRETRLDQLLQDIITRRGRLYGLPTDKLSNLWFASNDVPFRGIDGLAGVTSYYRTFLRGDIKVTQFLRDIAATDDRVAQQRMNVFSTLLLSVMHYEPDQAANYASAQIRRISEEVGSEFTVGHEAFIEAVNASPTRLFDTSVWTQRRFW